MIAPSDFYNFLSEDLKINFYCGVPDSLLKDLCSYIADHAENHLICANEGHAIASAIGYHLSSGSIPCIYMQNSGFSNALNPVLSMASQYIYKIPMLIIVGWRGDPDVQDEPQHFHQGKVMLQSLEAMELEYDILPNNFIEAKELLDKTVTKMKKEPKPHFLIVKAHTFSEYHSSFQHNSFELKRELVIETVMTHFPQSKFFATTGHIARELYELRDKTAQDHSFDFLSIGGMGHVCQMAYSYSKYSQKHTVCLDGDGSILMHLGGLTSIQHNLESPLLHLVLNNACHLSVGGQPTVGDKINLSQIAKACGFYHTAEVHNMQELIKELELSQSIARPVFLDVKVSSAYRKNLTRPTLSPEEMKNLFMETTK